MRKCHDSRIWAQLVKAHIRQETTQPAATSCMCSEGGGAPICIFTFSETSSGVRSFCYIQVPPQAEAASKRPPEPAARPSRRRWGADPGRAAPSAPMQNGLPSGLELPSGPATPLRPPAQQAMSRSEASSAMGDPGMSQQHRVAAMTNTD